MDCHWYPAIPWWRGSVSGCVWHVVHTNTRYVVGSVWQVVQLRQTPACAPE